ALIRPTLNINSSLTARLIAAPSPVRPDAGNESIVEMVAARVIATPNVPAVICRDEVLSYADLDRRANQLANRLIALGVKTGTLSISTLTDSRLAQAKRRSLRLRRLNSRTSSTRRDRLANQRVSKLLMRVC